MADLFTFGMKTKDKNVRKCWKNIKDVEDNIREWEKMCVFRFGVHAAMKQPPQIPNPMNDVSKSKYNKVYISKVTPSKLTKRGEEVVSQDGWRNQGNGDQEGDRDDKA